MPEWLIVCTVIHSAMVGIIWLAVWLDMPVKSTYDTERRKWDARIALAAPVWPLWIPAFIAYGIYRLIQIARTGE